MQLDTFELESVSELLYRLDVILLTNLKLNTHLLYLQCLQIIKLILIHGITCDNLVMHFKISDKGNG